MQQRSLSASTPSCAVSIQGLMLNIKVGVAKEERLSPQKILLDVHLSYPEIPKGCISDNLKQVICYAEVCTKISKFVKKKQFKLIESLAYQIYKELKTSYSDCTLHVKVTKYPKISNLQGYVVCEVKD